MENNNEKLAVVICRQPRSIPKGEILVEEIQGIHWDNISGGVKSRQGAYNLYGYISYELAVKLGVQSQIEMGRVKVEEIRVFSP